jgi:muramoyltetrapeptide carboxypeptidase
MPPSARLKPPRLTRGDLIGVVSPASPPLSSERIERGVRYLESLGYRVAVGKHAAAVHGYLAGTDEARAADFNAMVEDRAVKAIFAVRGGYGTSRILSMINFAALKRNPKIIAGYSDLTALQLAVYRKVGLVTFSGPMVGVEMWDQFDPYSEEHFWRLLTSTSRVGVLENPADEPVVPRTPGVARGVLLGGNLSLLISLLGTPYAPDLNRSILVLEDVDEAPHRVDRMLMHLRNAGITRRIAGLALGKFTDCVPSDPSKPHLTIDQVLDEFVGAVNLPTVSNIQYGHLPRKLTLPIGAKARLDVSKGAVEVLENAVR